MFTLLAEKVREQYSNEAFYDKEGAPYPHTNWQGVNISHASKLQKIYFRENTLTFFANRSSSEGEIIFSSLRPAACLQGFQYGHRDDPQHANWHINEQDISTPHIHLVINSLKLLSPETIDCFLKNVKRTELLIAKCLDGKTDCLLAEEDFKKISKEYQQFYQAQHEAREAAVTELTQKTVSYLEQIYSQSKAIYFHTILKTILQDYLRLYLLSHHYHPKKVNQFMVVMNAAINMAISLSLVSVGLEWIVDQVIKPAILKFGFIPEKIVDLFCNVLTAVTFLNNPLVLIESGLGGGAYVLGQYHAHLLIRLLPKIKKVKEEEHQLPQPDAVVSTNSGLRQRK
jgi:hypothetical protein